MENWVEERNAFKAQVVLVSSLSKPKMSESKKEVKQSVSPTDDHSRQAHKRHQAKSTTLQAYQVISLI